MSSFNRNPWVAAQERYLDGLSDEEKALYKEASVENLLYSTSAAQIRHEQNSKSRAAAKKLQPLIAAISQYGGALDVLSNTSTMFFSPIWGGLRVLLHIASEFDKYYSKLIDMLERIGDVIPRFKAYERLFPTHEQLLHSLSVVYLDIITFCVDAKTIFQKVKSRKRSRVSFPGSGLRALKVLWKPFDQEFGSRVERFRMHAERVDIEAQGCHMAEQAIERRNQGNERDAQALERRAAEKERERQLLVHKEKTRDNILKKLSKYDPEHKHRNTKRKRFEGTGKWMLDSPELKAWLLDPNSSLLWCNGIPGSGKTLVSSVVIDSIRDDHLFDGSSLVWFYCDYSESKTLDPLEIIGSLIKQLLSIRVLESFVESKLEKICDNDCVPGLDELFDMLLLVISNYPKVFIVIDGLDECKEVDRRNLFPLFEKLRTSSTPIVKMLITSRDEVDIRKSVGDAPSIQTSTSNTSSDMAIVVGKLVREELEGQRDWLHDEHLVQEIIDALVGGAQGMFLWVKFQFEDICEELSEEGVRDALKRLPHGLEETFIRALRKIELRGKAHMSAAKKLFMWLSCAKRVLSLEEMREAVSILPGDTDIPRKRLPDGIQLIRACGSLITYDLEEKTIQFAHYSVQQFLSSSISETTVPDFHFSQEEANTEAGNVCITYLSFSAFEVQVASFKNLSNEETQLLESSPTEWVPQLANLSESHTAVWNLLRGARGASASKCTPSIDFNKYLRHIEKPSKNIMHDYKLLDYVREFWLFHAEIDHRPLSDYYKLPDHVSKLSNTQMQFVDLVFNKKLFFQFRPWPERSNDRPPYGPYLQPLLWALENRHSPLAAYCLSKTLGMIIDGQILANTIGYNENTWCTLIDILNTFDWSHPSRYIFEALSQNRQSFLETHRKACILAISTGLQDVAMALFNENLFFLRSLTDSEKDDYVPVRELARERNYSSVVEAIDRKIIEYIREVVIRDPTVVRSR